LKKIKEKLNNVDIFQNNINRRPLLQMRLARKTLINCRLESEDKRDSQLSIQHELLIDQGKMTKADALLTKINREQQRKCWKLLRTMIHGEKQPVASHMFSYHQQTTTHKTNDQP
jgi:hypothetical protein